MVGKSFSRPLEIAAKAKPRSVSKLGSIYIEPFHTTQKPATQGYPSSRRFLPAILPAIICQSKLALVL